MCSGVFGVCCFIKVFFSTTVLFILLCTSNNYLSLVTPLLNSPSLASFHQQISSLFRGNMEGSVLQTLKVTGVAAPFQTSAGHPDHISPSHHDTDLSLNAFRELKNHLFILFNKSLLLQPRRREIS